MFWLFHAPVGAIPKLSQPAGMDTDHVNGTTGASPLAFTVFN